MWILITRKIKGMTIMELLVVVAIIAVLVLAAAPNYIRIKMESRRSDAHTSVIATEGIIERYLAENNKANFDTDDLALARFENYDEVSSTPILSNESYYRITIIPDSTGYTVKATATIDNTLTSCNVSGNETKLQCRDTLCREIYIYHGEKRSKNSSGGVSNATTTMCW